jgi:ribonuclease P protein component
LHYAAQPEVAVGAVIPKRWARRAVTRNTIKRQVYAVSNALATPISTGHYVVRLRMEFSRKDFPSATSDPLKHAVRAELRALWAKAVRSPAALASGVTP